MHDISQMIEDKGSYIASCPDCGFAVDIVEVYDAIFNGGNIADVITKWSHEAGNEKRDLT